MTKLTDENYYQDKTYLSNSRFKQYMKCQAKAYAVDNGEWIEDRDETALLVGNYVHSYFESEKVHDAFVEENKAKIIAKTGKNKGNLKADFVVGEKMINALKDDDNFNRLYHGYPSDDVKKEMIVTGEIEEVPIKGKLDSINLSRGYFVDLKTMRSIYNEEWNSDLHKKVPAAVNNILNFGYNGQLALYRELLRGIFDWCHIFRLFCFFVSSFWQWFTKETVNAFTVVLFWRYVFDISFVIIFVRCRSIDSVNK